MSNINTTPVSFNFHGDFVAIVNGLRYSDFKCLKTRLQSGMQPRQSVAFFTPKGFASMGAMGQKYDTRKGNTARSALYEFSTFAPTLTLEKVPVDFPKSHRGANHV